MTCHITRRPRVYDDLIDHYTVIYKDQPDSAEQFLDEVEANLLKLAEHPKMGSAVEPVIPRLETLRKWPIPGFRNFLIFYLVRPDAIEVIRVLNGARDIPAVLRVELLTDE